MSNSATDPKHSETLLEEVEPCAEKPKRSNSWEVKNAIIYDASNQTLMKEKKANLDKGKHTHVSIPKRAKSPLVKDRVRLSISNGSNSTATFLADVKLDNLGLWVAIQRYWGNIDEMWVKGVPNARCSVTPVKC